MICEFRMTKGIFLILCLTIFNSDASKLRPRVSLPFEMRENGSSTSSTISVQRFNGNEFYDFVKDSDATATAASEIEERTETTPAASGRFSENDEVVFSSDDEGDVKSTSKTSIPILSDGITEASSNNENLTVDSNDGSLPNEGTNNASDETTPKQDTPSPADPVPGQPGEAESEDSSSSSDESSSSSSEEFKLVYKKTWANKTKNQLNLRSIKAKDVYSSQVNFPKKVNKGKLTKSVISYL